MIRIPHIVILCTALSFASINVHAQSGWEVVDGIGYACGGESRESLDRLSALRDDAHVELLFTYGPKREPLSRVDVSVLGPVAAPLRFQSTGHTCLLRLPTGQHIIEGDFRGMKRGERIRAGNRLQRVTFTWGG